MNGKTGSVVLFLRNLPIDFSRRALREFVESELNQAGIRVTVFRNPCCNYSILRITDRSSGTQEYHGLVEIRPARRAMQAIRILNGKLVGGKPIEVRRYRHRSPLNTAFGMAQGRVLQEDGIPSPMESRRRNIKIELLEEDEPLGAPGRTPVLR